MEIVNYQPVRCTNDHKIILKIQIKCTNININRKQIKKLTQI